ncbi:MAG: hypothetical protein ACOC0P_00820 [Planctomycetota bacterium]
MFGMPCPAAAERIGQEGKATACRRLHLGVVIRAKRAASQSFEQCSRAQCRRTDRSVHLVCSRMGIIAECARSIRLPLKDR